METPTESPLGVHVRARACDIERGDNPRPEHEFDPEYITELAESFKAIGMLQFPLVRRLPNGKLQLVAGECRLRGWKQAFGDEAEIDLIVTDKDEKAWIDAASLTENVLRRAMSPVAQAEAAARMLGHCAGDRDEAAKRLGWSRPTLDMRLALMYAQPPVREALHKKQILLGHAELLALLRKEAQENGLKLLLAQEKLMSVGEFKAHLERAALLLDTAIFDKTQCADCQHNSSNSLFAETISGGKCANKACFDDKTESEIQARAAKLREDFQQVRIARAGENCTIIPLRADGAKGVGAEQATACRVCKSFGAVVSAVPDRLGQVYTNMCMDVPCNTKMVAARINAEKAAAGPAEAPSGTSGTPTGAKAKPDEKASGSGKKPTKSAASASVKYPEPSNAVKQYREKLWRAVYQRAVTSFDVPGNRAVLLAIMLVRPSVIDHHELATAMKDLIPAGGNTTDFGQVLQMVRDYSPDQLGAALKHIAANTSTSMPISDVVLVLKSFDVKLEDHWKVKKEFFELLTKNEIDFMCQELGIAKAMGAAYNKAKGLKVAEYIKAVLSVEGFDYHGRIPKLVSW
jgi:PRTRC genetic system ParB family protein